MPDWRIGLLGLGLLALGGAVGLDALGILEIGLFFRGWWTLLLIVPGCVGLIKGKQQPRDIALVAGGVVLLALVRGWLKAGFAMLLSAGLIAAGVVMIYGCVQRIRVPRLIAPEQSPESRIPQYSAALCGRYVSYDGLLIRGAELTAMAGALTCDLRSARFDRDLVIHADAVAGRVEILLPPNVQVLIGSTVCLGRIRERLPHSEDPCARIVYVDGMCVMGSVVIS